MTPETIRACVPLLYEVAPRLPDLFDLTALRADHRKWKNAKRSSYAMKHDVEYLLGRYVSNEELKEALRSSVRYSFEGGTPNYMFVVKPKFDLFWLRVRPTERPKGARKAQWEAYQTALSLAPQETGDPVSPSAPALTASA